jgi:Cu2+-exporting ATPase
LQHQGIDVRLLSGDRSARVQRLAATLGLTRAQAAATPQDKLRVLRDEQAAGRVVAMLGDGINDAPVLAQADVSLAMGEGADLARHSADAVLLSMRLADVAQAFALARRTRRVVRQNLVWAATYNAACIPLALVGALPPWLAGLGMAASSLVVMGNALRLSR